MNHVIPNPSTLVVSISYNETTHHKFLLCCSLLSPKVTNKNYHEHKSYKNKKMSHVFKKKN